MTTNNPSVASGRTSAVVLDTHQKALAVNLDPTSFGSFAEIGAGQEVARWFLHVGAASGTVAKTVSAYDKEVSDDLYGSGTRYVSKPRLQAMLDCEWKALSHQIGQRRSETTRFFAFANTIAARNFAGTNDCHGWVGVRFQHRPRSEPNEILLHVNLREPSNQLQQQTVGILGVNLIHALLGGHEPTTVGDLPDRLFDGLSVDRMEIDEIELRGGAFAEFDVRQLHVTLARNGHAEAITFAGDGTARAANEFLYKKAVVIAPVAHDPNDDLSPSAIAACIDATRRELAGNTEVKDVIDVRLLTAGPNASSDATGGGRAAMLTRHQPLYRASAFVRRYTRAPLRFAMTLPAMMHIFNDVRDHGLDGRLLEAVSRLFEYDVRILAYSLHRDDLPRVLNSGGGDRWEIDNGAQPLITAAQIRPVPPLGHLYEYLLATGFIVAMPQQ